MPSWASQLQSFSVRSAFLSAHHPAVTDTDDGGRVLDGSAHLLSRVLVSQSASVFFCTLSLSLRATRRSPARKTAAEFWTVLRIYSHMPSWASQPQSFSLRSVSLCAPPTVIPPGKYNELERILMGMAVVYYRSYPGICLEGLMKITKTLSKISRCLGRDPKPRPPE
jgi:hypothetical protein